MKTEVCKDYLRIGWLVDMMEHVAEEKKSLDTEATLTLYCNTRTNTEFDKNLVKACACCSLLICYYCFITSFKYTLGFNVLLFI